MVRRLIIHAGMPRAGSSTIQEALFRQRRKLEPAGLLYATLDIAHSSDGSPGQIYNHRQLFQSAQGLWLSRRFHQLHAETVARVRDSAAPVAVLSYEGLWDPRNHRALKRSLKALRSGLADAEVTMAAVIRDPVPFLLSLYKLDVLHGRTKDTFEAYWPSKLKDPRLRYADIAAVLEASGDYTRFIRFETAVKDGRLVGNVLDALDLGGIFQRAGVAHLERHRSPGGAFFSDEVVTMMRFAASQLGLSHVARERSRLMPLFRRMAEDDAFRDDCRALVIPLSKRAATAIADATRPQAEAFYRRHFAMAAPAAPEGDDTGVQSSVDGRSAMGRAIMAELAKL